MLRCSILLIAGAFLALVSCTSSDAPGSEATATYRHAIDGVPGSLDPDHASDVYSSTVVLNLYDTLYRYKYLARPYELTPALARDFPEVSEDGLTYVIELRKDARFHDDPAFPGGQGRPVTAEDVVYSLGRHIDPATRSRGAWLWRGHIRGMEDAGRSGGPSHPIEGLEAVDAHTVRIRLTEPYPQLTHTLAMALSAVVPHEAVEHYGPEFGVHPVGSGPYRLTELDETRAVLEPNPAFDRGPLNLAAEGHDPARHGRFDLAPLDGRRYPFLDRLEIHFITEPATRWTSFATGREMHNVMVPPEYASRVLESTRPVRFRPEIRERYHTLAAPESGFVFYGFNMANPEIGHHDDPERDRRNRALRCAMRDAFDWEARNRTFYHELGEVFPGVIPPFLDAWDPGLASDSIEHDPEAARDRLAQHGWDEGAIPPLRYGMEASVQQRQMFEQFRAQMTEAGIPPGRITGSSHASFGEYIRAINEGELDVFLLGWTLAYPDAQYSLQLFYGPNAAPGANSFSYRNPEFDRLFEQAASMPPGPERRALYRRLNAMVIDDCVIIGSLSRTRLHLWHRNVRMLPDRELLGGFFLRFVDVTEPAPQ